MVIRPTFRRCLILVLLIALLATLGGADLRADAAALTEDPAHRGWDPVDNGGRTLRPSLIGIVEIGWQDYQSPCEPCAELANQYNATMSELLALRFHREVNRRKIAKWRAYLRFVQDGLGEGGLSDEEAAKLIGHNVQLMDAAEEFAEFLRQQIAQYEALADYYQSTLRQCENQCTGTEAQTAGGLPPAGVRPETGGAPPPVPEILAVNFPWQGPYPAVCFRCAKLAERLNVLPEWARVRQIRLQAVRNEIERIRRDNLLQTIGQPYGGYVPASLEDIDGLEREAEKLEGEIEITRRNFEATLELYEDCIELCPPSGNKCLEPPAKQAVLVGPNGEVGSGARLKEKAQDAVIGAVGGLLGLGGGGSNPFAGGGDASAGPENADDPIDDDDKVENTVGDVALAAGAALGDDGLIVSTKIKDAPGNGTFQAVFLEDHQGRRIAPYRYAIYDLWAEWELTVSWTRDRWVDGQHVEHSEGSWTENWTEDLGRFSFLLPDQAQEAGIWNKLGFDNASHGIQSLGSRFKVDAETLKAGPVNLVIHVTRPENDPVDTVAIVYELSPDPDADDKVVVTPVDQTLAEKRDCYKSIGATTAQ